MLEDVVSRIIRRMTMILVGQNENTIAGFERFYRGTENQSAARQCAFGKGNSACTDNGIHTHASLYY